MQVTSHKPKNKKVSQKLTVDGFRLDMRNMNLIVAYTNGTEEAIPLSELKDFVTDATGMVNVGVLDYYTQEQHPWYVSFNEYLDWHFEDDGLTIVKALVEKRRSGLC
jgi:hypothetical protein